MLTPNTTPRAGSVRVAAKRPVRRLILVFNADSGAFHAFLDSARKVFKVNGCALCTITHGLLGEKSEWTSCRETLGVPVDSLHRDELDAGLKKLVGGDLPCVLAETDDGPVKLLTPDVLERCKGSVADFKGRLHTRAAMYDLELPG